MPTEPKPVKLDNVITGSCPVCEAPAYAYELPNCADGYAEACELHAAQVIADTEDVLNAADPYPGAGH